MVGLAVGARFFVSSGRSGRFVLKDRCGFGGFGGWSAFFRQSGQVGEIRIKGPERFWWVWRLELRVLRELEGAGS